MRVLGLWLLLASSAHAVTIGEIYVDQAAKLVARAKYCSKPYAYNDYMPLMNKVMREYQIEFDQAQEKIGFAADMVAMNGCSKI